MSTSPGTLPATLRRAADLHGDRLAVVDGATRLTYAGLLAEVRETARAFVALGVQPGDRVCLWAPNSWEWVVSALATSYAGATLVPLNTRYTGHEVVDVAVRTRATLLVMADGFLGRGQYDEVCAAASEGAASELGAEGDLVMGLPDLRAVVRIGDGPAPAGVVPFAGHSAIADRIPLDEVEQRADALTTVEVADILFTSGTTGRSKGVMSAHSQTIAAADVWARTCAVTAADRYLMVNPFFHAFGYKAGIVVCLLTGATMYPQATFDVGATLRLVSAERITVLPGAPTVFHSLFGAPELPATDLSSLRLAVTGATTVPVALVERMQSELSFDTVLTAYGMTECVVATMCRPGDPDDLVAGTCGAAVEGLQLRITDPHTGEALPAGSVGEVRMRGPMVMLGYLDDDEATAATIDPGGWLHSGDVGTLDDGGHLRITDRLKDMYISGGFNVYPAEVEQVLGRLEGVTEAAVIGVADERLGEVGLAYVVRRDTDLTAADVLAFARTRLANFKVPKQVAFVDALPRNGSGKVLKQDLRQAQEPTRSNT
ncbi:Long-chain fatty-acid-CoA ligase, Mycobacterial subgroup FadD3 [Alloactinosynnema sp. L-07]|uniref:FadD3 family acyl-CoA ligase n=1 Tax=Alloactinosynnema sp. L-07 TaxID=1653480 RepID=UPI00065F0AC9|nr:FadD3 family acyl-CoA ligase [Alloactinosynnema sp. L-07]CRK57775.1 Long-chain fatty-acid-CoA ligase, Mycobacterial subgroup FadD3 [Alloactinosynnema sp. L-07]